MRPGEWDLLEELRAEIRDAESVRMELLSTARSNRDLALRSVEFRYSWSVRNPGDDGVISALTIASGARVKRIELKKEAEKAYAKRVLEVEGKFTLALAEIDRRYRERLETLRADAS